MPLALLGLGKVIDKVAVWFLVVHISEMPECVKARLTMNADIWNPAYNSAVRLYSKDRWHGCAVHYRLRP